MKYLLLADVSCSGDISTCCSDYALANYLHIIKEALNLIHFIVPIILIIMATINIVQLMLSPDDPQKKKWKSLINKFLAAIIVFFIPVILNVLFNLLPDGLDIAGCWNAGEEIYNDLQNNENYNFDTGESSIKEEKILSDEEIERNKNLDKAKVTLESLGCQTEWYQFTKVADCAVKNTKNKFNEIVKGYDYSAYINYLSRIVNGENLEYLTIDEYMTKYGSNPPPKTEQQNNSNSSNITASVESNTKNTTNKKKTKTTTKKKVKKKNTDTEKSNSRDGKEVVKYAKKFLGNPYVYGGTDLEKGTDCSGFVMRIYEHFGITIPRTAAAQSKQGKKVASINDAKPGDLFFYSGNCGAGICHVTMYEGNGKVIHASSARTGIIESNSNYRTVSIIKRFL